jgi:DME family drug/metabolite transporter
MTESPRPASPTRGRLLILLATLLWSLNGFFMPLLTSATPLGLHVPPVEGMHVCFFRAFFAGLVLAPTLRRSDIAFRRPMLFTAGCFAVMNLSFVLAMAKGGVASTLFLQYTAPAWLYLASVFLLREPPSARNRRAVILALTGVIIIVAGGWGSNQLPAMGLGVLSGVTFAGVLLGLRFLRHVSSTWITVVNLLTAAAVALPFLLLEGLPMPAGRQLVVLAVFGGVQLGLPYLLMARGLQSVSPREAGTLSLAEPLLSTLWAYLIGGQVPTRWTLLGGLLILAALLYQYAPRRAVAAPDPPR